MTTATPLERLGALPRAALGTWPTPLQLLERFSDAVGVEVWCKRDDIGSVGLAGNKVRKYELVLGRALAEGADVLVTTGATQSNSARAGAAAAASLGLDCVLVLSGPAPDEAHANYLLANLFGATIVHAPGADWMALDRTVDEIAERLRAEGRSPVVGPVGCSSPLGCLGFALAAVELDEQLAVGGSQPTAVYHASTSGGTHAGLLVGRAMLGAGWALRGIDAGRLSDDPRAQVAGLADEAGRLVGVDARFDPTDVDLDLSQLGDGYGIPTDEATRAIDLLARTEGIVCDPVYSGKGLAGLVTDAATGVAASPVVFWHTGGYHALFDPRYGAAQLRA